MFGANNDKKEAKGADGKEVKIQPPVAPKIDDTARALHVGDAAFMVPPVVAKQFDEKTIYGKKACYHFPKDPQKIGAPIPDNLKKQFTYEEMNDAKGNVFIAKVESLLKDSKDQREIQQLRQLKEDHTARCEYQKQLTQLVNAIKGWYEKNKAYATDEQAALDIPARLDLFLKNITAAGYVDSQGSVYFDRLKRNLESIFVYLQQDKRDILTKLRKIAALSNEVIACGPGVGTHVGSMAREIDDSFSIINSLAELRNNIIQMKASAHVQETKVCVGNEIHVLTSMRRLAEQEGLGVEENNVDPHHSNTLLDEKANNDFFSNPNNRNRKSFNAYFKAQYTPDAIIDRLMLDLNSSLNQVIDDILQDERKDAKASNKKRKVTVPVRYDAETQELVVMPDDKAQGTVRAELFSVDPALGNPFQIPRTIQSFIKEKMGIDIGLDILLEYTTDNLHCRINQKNLRELVVKKSLTWGLLKAIMCWNRARFII